MVVSYTEMLFIAGWFSVSRQHRQHAWHTLTVCSII